MNASPNPRRGVSALARRQGSDNYTGLAARPDISALLPTHGPDSDPGEFRERLDRLSGPGSTHPDLVTAAAVPGPADLDAARQDPAVADARRYLDRELVRRLAAQVAELLVERRGARAAAAADPHNTAVTLAYTAAEIDRIGREIVVDLVHQDIVSTIDLGQHPLNRAQEQALVQAVYDHVFGLGVMQPLVDRADVENILHTGGHTSIMFPDGTSEQVEGVFESEEEAIGWVRGLADRAPGGGRPFSPANPALRLNLGDEIRLTAIGWATNGVSITIRKHLHKDITLDRLVEMEVMPGPVSDLLAAASLSACSIIASGPMGVGKTTMIRALAAELPTHTRIGTAELVRELFLHKLPGREPYVVSAEVITGGGERHELTDQMKGAFNLHMILEAFPSQQLDRVIVGEVTGKEILAMCKAMQMAHGSMTTVHATSARGAIDRLVTLMLEEPGVDKVYAIRQVAAHVQLIVQMRKHESRADDGTLHAHRFVSEIAWIEPGEEALPAVSTIYRRRTPFTDPQYNSLPEPLRERVLPHGFNLHNWPSLRHQEVS